MSPGFATDVPDQDLESSVSWHGLQPRGLRSSRLYDIAPDHGQCQAPVPAASQSHIAWTHVLQVADPLFGAQAQAIACLVMSQHLFVKSISPVC